MNRTTTKSGRLVKAPIFHTLTTKLEAIRRVNTLMDKGYTPNKARTTVAREVEVHPTTLSNWQEKHNLSLKQTEPINDGINTFSINSLTVRTTNGFLKLTPHDIKNIARLDELMV